MLGGVKLMWFGAVSFGLGMRVVVGGHDFICCCFLRFIRVALRRATPRL